jgi:hypothetical protein
VNRQLRFLAAGTRKPPVQRVQVWRECECNEDYLANLDDSSDLGNEELARKNVADPDMTGSTRHMLDFSPIREYYVLRQTWPQR